MEEEEEDNFLVCIFNVSPGVAHTILQVERKYLQVKPSFLHADLRKFYRGLDKDIKTGKQTTKT